MPNSDAKHMMRETSLWLAANSVTKESLSALKKLLRFHEHRYYVLNEPLVSDSEYDQLFKLLEKAEKGNPGWVTPDSPTQRVGSSLNEAFNKAQHLVAMLSLENSYNSDDLVDWDRKVRELTKLNVVEYCVEPKFDGASISLIYENDHLERCTTRGDGVEGEEITRNGKQIRTIPLSARFSDFGIAQIEIRGEVMMNKTAFKKFNDQLAEHNVPPLANPRNAASGSLRMKDPKDVAKRNLDAFLYHVSYLVKEEPRKEDAGKAVPTVSKELSTHASMLELLWELGFKSPVKEMRVFKGIDDVVHYCREFEQTRDEMPYEIDGMVIKVNGLDLQDRLGQTTHHPRWAIAYKFKARQASSKLRAVEFQVGRTGSITPVAKIDPVHIGGVTVTSISLFNEDVIREKDLMTGDTVLVERAGDVIPYIVRSQAELRTGTEKKIQFPKECPACNGALYKEDGEAVWRCTNIECPAQVVERIIHYVSKDAMDIKSFGEANVRKFYDLGWLKDIPGLYKLEFEKIGKLEGFGKKSIDNLQAAIEASKKQPLHRLVFGLGIRYVGETTAKVLANTVTHLLEFKDYTEEQLMQLDDVGVKVAKSIVQFFSNEPNIHMLEELQELGVRMENQKKAAHEEGGLNGQTFLFTGTLSKLKRTEAEEMVEQLGGKNLGGVSSKLNYLVVGEDAGSKLEKARKINTVKVISEDAFITLVEKYK